MANRFEEQRPWKPKKEFFETNERSKALRNIAVEVVDDLETLIEDREVNSDEKKKAITYARLEAADGKLKELGITVHMNAGLSEEAYKSDPVLLAEFIAGQILDFLTAVVVTKDEVRPHVEGRKESGEDVHKIDRTRIHPKIENYAVLTSSLTYMRTILDAPKGE
jgi:hypothetical protein